MQHISEEMILQLLQLVLQYSVKGLNRLYKV